MTDSVSGAPQSAMIDKGTLVVLTAVASVVGVVPGILLLQRVHWLPYFAIGSTIVALLAVYKLKLTTTNRPGPLELILGWVGAIFPPAVLSLCVILVYWFTVAVFRAMAGLADWLGRQLTLVPSRVGFYVAITVALIWAPAFVIMGVRGLARQLYPETAGIKSPFYTLIATRRLLLLGVAILALGAFLALVLTADLRGRWFYLLLDFYLLAVSAALWELGEQDRRPHAATDAGQAIRRLLGAQGFTVIASPRTGEQGIDPHLLKVDLFAHRGGQAFAIGIETAAESPAPVEWVEASSLVIAAGTLTDAPKQLGLDIGRVEPLMVLVGRVPADSLSAFARAQSIRILQIPDASVLRRALGTDDPRQLRALADEYLGPLTEAATPLAVGDQLPSVRA